ncbi:hypothetical protein C2S51_018257 [Perilla frutescens var. frutescens]|nr:hypothetical protein C2S51_018257 [Perilla frutescens var. frutescens]
MSILLQNKKLYRERLVITFTSHTLTQPWRLFSTSVPPLSLPCRRNSALVSISAAGVSSSLPPQPLQSSTAITHRQLIGDLQSAATVSLSPLGREALASEDPLSEWERVTLPIDPGVVLLDIAFVPDDPSHGNPAILVYTTDAGETWQRIPLSSQLPGDMVYIEATGGKGAEMVSDQGAIYVTSSGGFNWKAAVQETVSATLNRLVSSEALLANMAATYAVYHGPEGLQMIAQRVYGVAGTFAAGLKKLGTVEVQTHPFFDTVKVKCTDAKGIADVAYKNEINLQIVDANTGSICNTVVRAARPRFDNAAIDNLIRCIDGHLDD